MEWPDAPPFGKFLKNYKFFLKPSLKMCGLFSVYFGDIRFLVFREQNPTVQARPNRNTASRAVGVWYLNNGQNKTSMPCKILLPQVINQLTYCKCTLSIYGCLQRRTSFSRCALSSVSQYNI